jgi:hypothetical protein
MQEQRENRISTKMNPTKWHAKRDSMLKFQASAMSSCWGHCDENFTYTQWTDAIGTPRMSCAFNIDLGRYKVAAINGFWYNHYCDVTICNASWLGMYQICSWRPPHYIWDQCPSRETLRGVPNADRRTDKQDRSLHLNQTKMDPTIWHAKRKSMLFQASAMSSCWGYCDENFIYTLQTDTLINWKSAFDSHKF